ncbi:MAG: ABC transporter substrate-binding protein [Candidatus Odyssella sp.]|nr:ABC transporter substrate-binding protein [Candidatus Odyssella sp.]
MRLTRRRFTAAAAAAGALPLIAPRVRAQAVKLRVSTIPIIDTAGLQIAMAKGFFKEQDLEIDTTPTAGGAAGLPALAAGQVQIAFSNIISTVLAVKQNLGFLIVSGGSGTGDAPPDLAGIVTKPGAGLKTGKDFEGKTIAVNTRNNIIWLYARAWVKKTGGDPDKVTYLEVPFPQMIDAVRGGRVDAAFVVEPFFSAGQASKAVELVAWPYGSTQKRIPVAQFVASKAYIEANPGTIEKFVRAYNKGVDWMNANKGGDEWAGIIAGYTRLKPEQIKSIGLPVFEKTVDPRGIDETVALMREHKMIEGAVDAKAMLYKTAVEAVK